MDWTAVALWLASQGAHLIEKGAELWAANGKNPEEFEAAVSSARTARKMAIDRQRDKELAILNGSG